MTKIPELLMPCGSPETVPYAIAGGADAIYFGGTLFNARMNAKNFDRDSIIQTVTLCHRYGVKCYVTLNIQIYDKEMKEALDYAGFLYTAGVDALIITDMGLAALVHQYYPDFDLHASTQMTVHNLDAVRRLHAAGYQRVVVAREISRENLETVCRGTDCEIEMFVHGAICVCTSGQCLMSAMLGGRSGNRGECAQPCRMKYNDGYPISLKDMALAEHIPEIMASGVASLKVEGRMKSPSYVYGVAKIYRRLLDENRKANAAEMKELAALFSRGGFTDGYFVNRISQDMLGVRSEQDKAQSQNAQVTVSLPSEPRRAPAPTRQGSLAETPAKLYMPQKRPAKEPIQTARFNDYRQIPANASFEHIYLPLNRYHEMADGITLPPVIFDSEMDEVRRMLEDAVHRGARHAWVSNLGQLSLLQEFDLIPHLDYRMNLFNTQAANSLARFLPVRPESVILSVELTLPQIRDIYLEKKMLKGAIVYGRIPLMLLEKPVGKPSLRDSRNAVFPILRENSRDMILNSVPVYMAEYKKRLDEAGIQERHFLFTNETAVEAAKVIAAYQKGTPGGDRIRRIR